MLSPFRSFCFTVDARNCRINGRLDVFHGEPMEAVFS
jgi:hypothetical protein